MFSVSILNSWYFVLGCSDFDWGFGVRCVHVVCTSGIFFLFYIHIIRSIIYLLIFDGAILVWGLGAVIYIGSMIIAFIGYVLPSTQMSFWGLTVFSNILTTVPIIGVWICYWIWGCEFIQDFTLYKCHAIHMILPCILLFLCCYAFVFSTLLFKCRWVSRTVCFLCWKSFFLQLVFC